MCTPEKEGGYPSNEPLPKNIDEMVDEYYGFRVADKWNRYGYLLFGWGSVIAGGLSLLL